MHSRRRSIQRATAQLCVVTPRTRRVMQEQRTAPYTKWPGLTGQRDREVAVPPKEEPGQRQQASLAITHLIRALAQLARRATVREVPTCQEPRGTPRRSIC